MYPASLSPIPDPPSLLRYLGDPAVLSTPCIAIVGTRRCTAMGLRQAGRFAQGLVEAGCTIVSGGARGIDGEAHRATLRFGGRTVAVLGGGLGCPHPIEHESMFESIAASGGAMITARTAVEEHGIDAMTVPGPADSWPSSGCHHAVQEGWAHLVTSPGDVMRLLEEDYSSRVRLQS